ncbi:MAG: alpha-L-rhamnosidase C-terminal domain-containing protein [Pedobacter sp.]
MNAVATAPGYKEILIKPIPGGKLTSASAELDTSYGIVKSAWTLADGLFKLDVSIPANAKATVVLPVSGKKEQIGSGKYHYEYKY